MDYVQIIESYVRTAWDQGKSTIEIKEELRLKRWPDEMVEVVIDRLVKQRLVRKEGKSVAINGPDFWSQPSWPVGKSWAKPKGDEQSGESLAVGSEAGVSKKSAPSNCKKEFSEFVVTQAPQRSQQVKVTTKKAAPASISKSKPAIEKVILPFLPDTKIVEQQVRIKAVKKKKSPEEILQELKIEQQSKPKLVNKIKKIKETDERVDGIQTQAMWVLGGLILVIILALLWRTFVIK